MAVKLELIPFLSGGNGFRGFKLWHIQNGIFDLDRLQATNFVFVFLHFRTWQCFVKFTDIQNTGKRLAEANYY